MKFLKTGFEIVFGTMDAAYKFYYYFSLVTGVLTALGSPLIVLGFQEFMSWVVSQSYSPEPIVWPEFYFLTRSIALFLGGTWLAGGTRLWWRLNKSDYFHRASFMSLGRLNAAMMALPWVGWFVACFTLVGEPGSVVSAFASGSPRQAGGFS